MHRFSHSTMPMLNLFKNCTYYWGFTAYVAYHVNHPLFTSPSLTQVYGALVAFLLCELGNFSVHIALRNLRPPGTRVRKIPVPDGNPLTALFKYAALVQSHFKFFDYFFFNFFSPVSFLVQITHTNLVHGSPSHS